ncbi:AAA family ATPase [Nonomuraea fuscirosea]|uniref:helix-turn-helix transcriptional regulator n=1 Tax=Nonomuraea fuscirosea TaxID=1291556 RepID=UPI003721D89F
MSTNPVGSATKLFLDGRVDADLAAVLDGTATGVRVIEVSGEAGVGKTRLLGEITGYARDHGWTVVSNISGTAPRDLPFGAFADALDDILAFCGDGLVAGFSYEHVRWLAGTFPALATAAPGADPREFKELYHAFHAVRGLLGALCLEVGGNGLVVIIDDAHRADDASLELLRQLAGRPPSAGLMLVVAHRPRQADRMLRELLAAGDAAGVVRRIEPAPLEEREALVLLPGSLNEFRRRGIVRAAGGNPGTLEALVLAGAAPYPDEEPARELPVAVMSRYFRDIRALSPLGTLVAQALAVTGDPFRMDLLRAVAELSEPEVWAALDELVGDDVLRAEGTLLSFRFRDPFLRGAAYRSAGAGWRIGGHSRAAAVLRADGAPPTVLAPHLVHTIAAGDEAGARILLDAARACVWSRPARTVSWARAALQSLEPAAEVPADLLLVLGEALVMTGSYADGVTYLGAACAHGDRAAGVWAEAVEWQARGLRLLGRHAEATGRLRAALNGLPADAGDHRLRLRMELLAAELDRHGAPDPAREAAAPRPAPPSDPALGAHLLALLAAADVRQGVTGGMETRVDQAARQADSLSDDEIVRHLELLRWLGGAELSLMRYQAARGHLERGLALAERHGLLFLTASFSAQLNDLLSRQVDGPEPDPGSSLGDPGDVAAVNQLRQLSGRELEIAMLVSDGRTNQQIARALDLSHKTVETYLARIFKKLGVCSRAQVAALIGRYGHTGDQLHKVS